MSQSTESTESFAGLYCGRFRCPRDRFAWHVFWSCIPPIRRPFVALLMIFQRHLFDFDFELIQAVSHAQDVREFENELALCVMGIREWSLLRDGLRLRVSRCRLRRLGARLLSKTRVSAALA